MMKAKFELKHFANLIINCIDSIENITFAFVELQKNEQREHWIQ